jgi:hypothetical protein
VRKKSRDREKNAKLWFEGYGSIGLWNGVIFEMCTPEWQEPEINGERYDRIAEIFWKESNLQREGY